MHAQAKPLPRATRRVRVWLVVALSLGVALLAPANASANWSSTESLMPSGWTSTSPVQVAYDRDGNGVAVFTRYVSGFDYELYIRERPAAGGPWGPPQLVGGADVNSYMHDLDVAMNDDGDLVVAFRSGGTHALYRPAGGSWGALQTWSSPGSAFPNGGCPQAPSVAIGDDGTAAVAWSPINSCNGVVTRWRVVAAAYSPGSGWENTAQVFDASPEDVHSYPGVGVENDGRVVVAFSARVSTSPSFVERAYTVERAPDGTWGTPEERFWPGATLEAPAVASRGSTTVVAWIATSGTYAAVHEGSTWSGATPLPYFGQPANESPAVAVGAAGKVYASAAILGGSGFQVRLASRPAGGSWSDEPSFTAAPANSRGPALAANQQGDVVLAWEEFDGGLRYGRVALNLDGVGWPSVGTQVSNVGSSNTAYARVAIDRFGHAIAVVSPISSGFATRGDHIIEQRVPVTADAGNPPSITPASPSAGDTITCDPGTFTGTAPIRYSYSWTRDGDAIAGETGDTYVVRASDALSSITCSVEARNEGGTASADAAAVTVAAADADGDGVNDDIQTAPGSFSDGTTFGSITATNGLSVLIVDADPEGVRITVTGTGTAKATFSVCGFATLKLGAGSDVIVTCGSVEVEVVSGSAQVELGGGLTVVTIPAGVTAKITQIGSGYSVENLGGGAVTLTVDGVTSTIVAGATSSVQAWDFVGLAQPVDAAPTLNAVKAGQSVPLKWRLLDASGAPVTNLGSASVRVAALACAAGAAVDQVEEVAPGASTLQNLGDGYYQLNWKTEKSYGGSCRTMKLDVGDGVTHDALFKFSK